MRLPLRPNWPSPSRRSLAPDTAYNTPNSNTKRVHGRAHRSSFWLFMDAQSECLLCIMTLNDRLAVRLTTIVFSAFRVLSRDSQYASLVCVSLVRSRVSLDLSSWRMYCTDEV